MTFRGETRSIDVLWQTYSGLSRAADSYLDKLSDVDFHRCMRVSEHLLNTVALDIYGQDETKRREIGEQSLRIISKYFLRGGATPEFVSEGYLGFVAEAMERIARYSHHLEGPNVTWRDLIAAETELLENEQPGLSHAQAVALATESALQLKEKEDLKRAIARAN